MKRLVLLAPLFTGCSWGGGLSGGGSAQSAATASALGGVKGTGSALVCTGSAKVTGFAADGTLQCAADESGSGLPADPTACGANQFVTDQNASGVLSCAQPAFSNLSGSATDGQIPNTITIDLSSAATALAANPANCADATHFSTGVNASGVADCEAIADADVPNTITLDNLTQVTTRAISDTTGVLAGSRGGVGVALPTCSGTDKLTSNGTQVSCAVDQGGAGSGAPRIHVPMAASVLPNVLAAGAAPADNCTLTLSNLASTKRLVGSQVLVTMTGFANATGVFRLKNAGGQSGQISCQIRNLTDSTTLIGSTNVTTGTVCVTATGTASGLALTGVKQFACECSNATATDDPLLGYCGLELAP